MMLTDFAQDTWQGCTETGCTELQALHDGESYEICLTTALVRTPAVDAYQLYTSLRHLNPAPYAAWLSFADTQTQVSSSLMSLQYHTS